MSDKKKKKDKEENDGFEEEKKDKKKGNHFGITEAPKGIPGNEKGNLKIIME